MPGTRPVREWSDAREAKRRTVHRQREPSRTNPRPWPAQALAQSWNHIASSHDEDFVADVDVEAVHLSHVVERGVLDGHAAHTLGCDGHGRDVPGSSGLPFNVHED